jgi:hypothetical protein
VRGGYGGRSPSCPAGSSTCSRVSVSDVCVCVGGGSCVRVCAHSLGCILQVSSVLRRCSPAAHFEPLGADVGDAGGAALRCPPLLPCPWFLVSLHACLRVTGSRFWGCAAPFRHLGLIRRGPCRPCGSCACCVGCSRLWVTAQVLPTASPRSVWAVGWARGTLLWRVASTWTTPPRRACSC